MLANRKQVVLTENALAARVKSQKFKFGLGKVNEEREKKKGKNYINGEREKGVQTVVDIIFIEVCT